MKDTKDFNLVLYWSALFAIGLIICFVQDTQLKANPTTIISLINYSASWLATLQIIKVAKMLLERQRQRRHLRKMKEFLQHVEQTQHRHLQLLERLGYPNQDEWL